MLSRRRSETVIGLVPFNPSVPPTLLKRSQKPKEPLFLFLRFAGGAGKPEELGCSLGGILEPNRRHTWWRLPKPMLFRVRQGR